MTAVAITPRSMRSSAGPHRVMLERAGWEVRWAEPDRRLYETEMVALVEGCEGLVVGVDPVTSRVLDAGPLRAVVKYGSGTDNIDLKAAEHRKVAVAATPGLNARSVAELTLALLFGLARHVSRHDRSVKKGSWARVAGTELEGKCLGIVGLGSVGREVARLAACLGMRTIAHDPYVSRVEEPALVPLDELLEAADAVSLHLPLTDETRGLLGPAELARMRKGAFLVNTARGGLVDEPALAHALSSGALGGAALDAFLEEPPGESPLLRLENFIASPHAGGSTAEAVERTALQAVRELLRLLSHAGDAQRTR